MAKFTELASGKWLKAGDVGPRGLRGIIEEITEEEVFQKGKKEVKQCIWIRGQIKGFLLNPTNTSALRSLVDAGLFPNDTDDCPGELIILKLGKVNNPNGGPPVDGIQINVDAMIAAKNTAPPIQPSRKPAQPVTQAEADEEIPF